MNGDVTTKVVVKKSVEASACDYSRLIFLLYLYFLWFIGECRDSFFRNNDESMMMTRLSILFLGMFLVYKN